MFVCLFVLDPYPHLSRGVNSRGRTYGEAPLPPRPLVTPGPILYALKSAGLMPGVPDKPSARSHVGTRTNQGSRIDYITEKRYLHHQLGVPRAPILAY